MRLTKTTSHAIRILIDCAQAGDQLIKVAAIAERLGITQLNVFKIVHLLSRSGYLQAVRGRNGGVRLARPAREIRIGDVVRSMEVTNVEVESAADGQKTRKKSGRQLNTIFDEALEAFISVLDRHTLEDMARGGAGAGSAAAEIRAPSKRRNARAPVRRDAQRLRQLPAR
jgi:Rrf2 family nitric oxide-sensitive transcriptional repressor